MNTENGDKSAEETDLVHRSVKKYKRPASGELQFPTDESRQPGRAWVDILKSTTAHVEPIPGVIYTGEGENDDEEQQGEFFGAGSKDTTQTNYDSTKVRIDISVDEWKGLWRPWRRALVIKLLGRTVSYRLLSQRLSDMWASNNRLEMIDLEDGYYVVRFYSKEDYEYALENGPWVIQGHYLTVNKFHPGFFPSAAMPSSTLVWVRIPRLPLELFNENFLMRLGNKLGKAVKVDHNTMLSARGKYARVCIEIDLQKPLVPAIIMNDHELIVEYENLHQICFTCGRYGHRAEECAILSANTITEVEKCAAAPTVVNSGEPFGPWMLAKNNNRRRPDKQQPKGDEAILVPATSQGPPKKNARVVPKERNTGSRFAPIADEVENDEAVEKLYEFESNIQQIGDSGPSVVFYTTSKDQFLRTRPRKTKGVQIKEASKVKYQPRTTTANREHRKVADVQSAACASQVSRVPGVTPPNNESNPTRILQRPLFDITNTSFTMGDDIEVPLSKPNDLHTKEVSAPTPLGDLTKHHPPDMPMDVCNTTPPANELIGDHMLDVHDIVMGQNADHFDA